MRLFPVALAGLSIACLPLALHAQTDEITPRIEAALAAQAAGDLKTTAAELAQASAAVNAERNRRLEALLPPAPEGMTQAVNADYAAGLAIMGGGAGAEGQYSAEDGSYATVTYNIDTPMMTSMMLALAAPEMAALMGPKLELNGLTFLDQGNSLTAIVDGRLLVTISGGDPATVRKVAEAVEGAALARFDAP